jgi:TRAP-type uncharacterized transport system fused permease subunit
MKVGLAACRLGWPAFALPFLFAWSPTLLLRGDPVDVGVSVVTAIGGVWLASAALAGYLFREMKTLKRIAFCAAAILMLLPNDVFAGVIWLELTGLALGAALVLSETRKLPWTTNAGGSRSA